MILDVPWSYGGFSALIFYGLTLGVLHTIMPCEDKFIFCFYAFGVARDWKQALRIVNSYGFGLFTMNLIIGSILAWFGAAFGELLKVNRFVWNAISSFSLIISGLVMIRQIKQNKYWPHGDQLQELTESIGALNKRRKTGFLLGMLAGIPPCLFEIAIYGFAITFSVQYGWGNGVWTIFFFGIGTWLGLYPLALVGTMSGRLSKALQESNLHQIQAKLKFNKLRFREKQKQDNGEKDDEDNGEISEVKFDPNPSKYSIYSKIEIFSAYALILFGIMFLILAILGKDLIPWEEVPDAPFPFNLF